jgi:purine-binding chemotaxis protein CheW
VARFADLLERFFYDPDEEVGAFLELAPEIDADAVVTVAEEPTEYLAFALGTETYAVPIALVREIMKVPVVTELPRAPVNVVGVINVRGEMVPLYDIRARLRLAQAAQKVAGPKDVARGSRVVLLKEDSGDAGILVERVDGVVKLVRSRVESPPNLGLERDCIAGLSRVGERLVILLDVEQALS